jgi:hypothetical protein
MHSPLTPRGRGCDPQRAQGGGVGRRGEGPHAPLPARRRGGVGAHPRAGTGGVGGGHGEHVDAVRGRYAGVRGGRQVSSLSDATSSLGDAKSSLGDAESSLGDAKSSLGDAESSLGDVHSRLRDACLSSIWGTLLLVHIGLLFSPQVPPSPPSRTNPSGVGEVASSRSSPTSRAAALPSHCRSTSAHLARPYHAPAHPAHPSYYHAPAHPAHPSPYHAPAHPADPSHYHAQTGSPPPPRGSIAGVEPLTQRSEPTHRCSTTAAPRCSTARCS